MQILTIFKSGEEEKECCVLCYSSKEIHWHDSIHIASILVHAPQQSANETCSINNIKNNDASVHRIPTNSMMVACIFLKAKANCIYQQWDLTVQDKLATIISQAEKHTIWLQKRGLGSTNVQVQPAPFISTQLVLIVTTASIAPHQQARHAIC